MKSLLAILLCLVIGLPCCAAEDNYPHITTLEQEILGQSYVSDELSARLSRMEAKAFGKGSSSDDLSQRTDDLEDYAQKTLHKKPFGSDLEAAADSDANYDSSSSMQEPNLQGPGTADDSAPAQYPHVTFLEKSILDQAYPNDELPDRLARLETKAFGKSKDAEALSDRTDALEGYVEKTLHKKAYSQEQAQEAAAYGGVAIPGSAGGPGGKASPSRLMSIAASSLLSIAGGSMLPGFGGINMIPRSAVNSGTQTPEDKPVEVHQDDPAVNAATPPSAGAAVQTQVGWCEMQLFGHTFHTMHLMERLKQLNLDLNYAPNKKPIDLMDDIGGIVKAVVIKKQKK